MNDDDPTYYKVLNWYDFASGFPALLGSAANSVAKAILSKWNQLRRPALFRMSNTELSSISGADESNIGRFRNRIIRECVVEEQALFEYTSRGKGLAGIYKIHTDVISDILPSNVKEASEKRQPNVNDTSNNPTSDDDPRAEKDREEKSPPPTTTIDSLEDNHWKEEAEELFSKLGIRNVALSVYPPKYVCDMGVRFSEKFEDDNIIDKAGYFVTLLRDPANLDRWKEANSYDNPT